MSFISHPWQLLLVIIAGWVNQQQQQIIDFQRTEIDVLKEKLGKKRILLNDDQRRRLAVKGRVLGRKVLEEIGCLFTPDMILRWHRTLVAQKWDHTKRRESVGPALPGVEAVGHGHQSQSSHGDPAQPSRRRRAVLRQRGTGQEQRSSLRRPDRRGQRSSAGGSRGAGGDAGGSGQRMQGSERRMSEITFTPGPTPNSVRSADGKVLTAPEGWATASARRCRFDPQGESGRRTLGRPGEEGPEGLLTGRLGTGSDHRPDSCRTRSRAIHRGVRQTQRGRCPTPGQGSGRIRRGLPRSGAGVPGLPSCTR